MKKERYLLIGVALFLLLGCKLSTTRPEDLMFKSAPPTIKFALGENPKQANFSAPGRDPNPGRPHPAGDEA